MLLYAYPKCSTCKNAMKFLQANNIEFKMIDIKENPPSPKELKNYIDRSNLPIQKFFNTSGLKYKELNLKEKMSSLTEEEKISLLSSDGMLIKRPLLIDDHFILVGFKEQEYIEKLKKEGMMNE